MSSTAGQAETVNSGVGGEQVALAIGALAGGGYAIAWAGEGSQVAVQRYDAAGARSGAPTAIAFDLGQHPDAAFAVLADASVVGAYTAMRTVPRDPYPIEVDSVLAQRFDAGGAAAGGPVEAGSLTHSSDEPDYRVPAEPGILTWPDGAYAVTWNVVAIRGGHVDSVTGAVASFDSRGEPVGRGARLFGAGEPGSGASFATLPDGGLLFVETYVLGGHSFARFSPSDSQDYTTAISTSADATALPRDSVLLALNQGGYVLWSTAGELPYLQVLDNAGAPAGARVPMAHAPYAAQALAGGGFVLFWQVAGQDGSGADLVSQRFDAAGTATGAEVRVETNGGEPLVTALADGGWALAWTASGADGSLDAFTQRFPELPPDPPAQPSSPAADPAGPGPGATILGLAGDDLLRGTAGNDSVDGGAGTDTIALDVSLAAVLGYSLAGGVLTVTTATDSDTVVNVERVRLADALFALDTQAPAGDGAGGHAWQAAALYRAAFGRLPGQADLSRWTAQADQAGDIVVLARQMVEVHAPGVSVADVVAHLYATLVGGAPDAATVQALASQFATGGDALAHAAMLPLNTQQMAGFTGSVQPLDPGWF